MAAALPSRVSGGLFETGAATTFKGPVITLHAGIFTPAISSLLVLYYTELALVRTIASLNLSSGTTT